jgi:hypothetical protein
MPFASLIVAISALVVAAASAVYSRQQVIASRRQAVASERVTAVETRRLHHDLTPDLKITCKRQGDEMATAVLELTGPAGLDRLDEVTVRIRDDRPGRSEEPDAPIWGPFRFNSGVRDTDSLGRQHGPFALMKNEPYRLSLERSIVPGLVTDRAGWHRQFAGKPVRLEVTCRRGGYEPWSMPLEVVPDGPASIRYLPA